MDKLHAMAEALMKYETIDAARSTTSWKAGAASRTAPAGARPGSSPRHGGPQRHPGLVLRRRRWLRAAAPTWTPCVAPPSAWSPRAPRSRRRRRVHAARRRAVSEQEELDRVVPVVEALARTAMPAISVDTSKPEVMRAAARAGAGMINDVRALRAPGALDAARHRAARLPDAHAGRAGTMQRRPQYVTCRRGRGLSRKRVAACVARASTRERSCRSGLRLRQDPGAQSRAAARLTRSRAGAADAGRPVAQVACSAR
jgi:hypothetical protein